jgi:hypothetical protein
MYSWPGPIPISDLEGGGWMTTWGGALVGPWGNEGY